MNSKSNTYIKSNGKEQEQITINFGESEALINEIFDIYYINPIIKNFSYWDFNLKNKRNNSYSVDKEKEDKYLSMFYKGLSSENYYLDLSFNNPKRMTLSIIKNIVTNQYEDRCKFGLEFFDFGIAFIDPKIIHF